MRTWQRMSVLVPVLLQPRLHGACFSPAARTPCVSSATASWDERLRQEPASLLRRAAAVKRDRSCRGRESEHAESLALTQLQGRRSGWVEVLLVLGRGLDKHSTSVVGPRTTIWPDVHFSVGPAQFVNTYWRELLADGLTGVFLCSLYSLNVWLGVLNHSVGSGHLCGDIDWSQNVRMEIGKHHFQLAPLCDDGWFLQQGNYSH